MSGNDFDYIKSRLEIVFLQKFKGIIHCFLGFPFPFGKSEAILICTWVQTLGAWAGFVN